MTTLTQPGYRQRVGYHATLLGGIALLASAVLVIADLQTRGPIAHQEAAELRRTLEQVLPPSMHDNRPGEDVVELESEDGPITVYRARKDGHITGVAFRVTGQGYAGPIRLLMGVDPEGEVLGVRVLEHRETPGLGDRIEVERDPWITSFDGRSLGDPPPAQWAVEKDGGVFDQFTGATITPRAVVQAVGDGLRWFDDHRDRLLQPDTPPNRPETEPPASPVRHPGGGSGQAGPVWQARAAAIHPPSVREDLA
ncbi:electron transport complex subunit RsxG [Ectothiorhodospira mobilis]|uniref:electron transport complex subunit RsxG n=1 Tax=Ectothiorhodospira mobilis TaxID=195064 RepID=UPI001EE940DD|nr:electron transport complex subunit RsxG [Ectothiorhodospira mobilis]MCG5535646.1 electron transport complex subunit RsxG [Ectothiorhodospira mobilis]